MTAEGRPRPATVSEHLAGTKDSWHGYIDQSWIFEPTDVRYHLYIGLFCPFAHRANLVRHLKGLTRLLPISVVKPYPKGNQNGWPGWQFPNENDTYPDATSDHVYGSKYLHELYFKADPSYQGRYSVPVLWDRETSTIINNESAEIMRNLQTAFNPHIDDEFLRSLDFYPQDLQHEIDEICEWMQRALNTGVYKAGFASTQEVYDGNVVSVFAALNRMEKIIASNKGPFVLGKRLTEVDLRLYPTIIRFDVIYVQHFKCNLGTIRANYPQIHNWMKGLYWGQAEFENGRKVWGFGSETTDFKHIKENYSKSHPDINPKSVTPHGPWPNIEEGYETDYSKLAVGGIHMKEVVEMEAKPLL